MPRPLPFGSFRIKANRQQASPRTISTEIRRLKANCPLRVHAVQHARKWNRLPHVIEGAHPGHHALDAHAEARVRHAAVAAQVEIPLERLARQLVLIDARAQQFVA